MLLDQAQPPHVLVEVLATILEDREQNRSENRDNGDDDEQFNQSEAVTLRRRGLHGGVLHFLILLLKNMASHTMGLKACPIAGLFVSCRLIIQRKC